ncbi:hypothetical protein CVT25_004815 [Psilocybe cyanescens]|uniref:Uncharacterized protein n=1 Tax=Psilocybe cyanescens TaxID=93625 RepID=A0A409XGL1_PSICY|nr:hypothetical protein CVT25_004815 [Psilocybe cyanescens]
MSSPLNTEASSLSSNSSDTLLDSHQQHSLLHQKWQSMELGLRDIKVALGALRSACAVLEIQTERLGNEILAMKDIIDPFIREPFTAEGSQSTTQEPGTPARRPGILHRVNDSVDGFHLNIYPQSTSFFTPPRTELLGKRHLLEDTDDSTDESVNYNDRSSQRASKRVRFADTEDLPISHLRTPMHQLDATSGSNDLPLPRPKRVLLTLSRNAESTSLKEDKYIETNTSPISPPSSPIILPMGKARNTRPKFRDSMTYYRNSPHPRQKTRWDPTTGKRVPIATHPSTSTDIQATECGGVATPTTEDDYEGRLSDNLSNTSIG